MKKLLIVLLTCLPFFAGAQKPSHPNLDSMMREYAKAKEDSNKVILCYLLSIANGKNGADSQLKYALEGIELSKKIKYKRGESGLYVRAGLVCHYSYQTDRAIEFYQKAAAIYKEANDKKKLTIVYGNTAAVYLDKNDNARALDYFFKALKGAEELDDKTELGKINGDIGLVYLDEKHNDLALEYFRKGLKLNEITGNVSGTASNMVNISRVYVVQRKYGEALDYATKALKISEEQGDKQSICKKLTNLGNVHSAMGNPSGALTYYLKVVDILGPDNKSGDCYGNIGQAYAQFADDTARKNNFSAGSKAAYRAKAITYLNQAITNGLNYGDILNTSEYYKTLANVQEKTGNNAAALKSFRQYKMLYDSMYNTQNKEKITSIETQRDLDLKDRDIKIKNEQIKGNALVLEKKRNQQVFSFVGLGLLGLVTVNVVRNNRKQKRTNTLLNNEKIKSDSLTENLRESLVQKDMLMKEIHHRVKNNLTVISALLELQLENVSDIHAIGAMTASTTRVRSISLIHQQLYQDEHLTVIELSKFTTDLFHQVSIIFKKEATTITLNNKLGATLQDIDTAVPLGLILNELMTNSYKYAFTGTDTGSITVSIEQRDDLYHLLYSDSGPGLPQGFEMNKLQSLGMRVIRNLSKQLGGKFYYDFDTKVFHVTFKDLEERKKIA